MHVKELTCDLGHATVVLSYEEIRDLNNLLYKVNKENLVSEINSENLASLSRQFSALHLLAKEGALQFLKVDWKLS